MVPSGLISVMPQPCATSTPCSFQKRSIMASGTAEPPISVRLTDDILSLFCAQYSSSASHTVGTPALIVTCSLSRSS